jgi:Flp pilus assembly protein TadG
MRKKLRVFLNERSGSITIIAAIGMVVFCGFVALAIDIGHMMEIKNELQRSADASAIAGARGLYPVNLYAPNPYYPNCTSSQAWAEDLVAKNPVDASSATVNSQVGNYNWSTKVFTAGCTSTTNAVSVTASRTGVQLYFGSVLGIGPFDIAATATAVMDWAASVPQGTIPVAVNKKYAMNSNPIKIVFNDDNSDTGSWFSKPPDSSSASTYKNYIENGTCPALQVGDTINLNNGVATSALQALGDALTAHGGSWDVYVPMVDTDKFNHNEPVAGFMPLRITEIQETGNDKHITGTPLKLGIGPGGTNPGGPAGGLLAQVKLVN